MLGLDVDLEASRLSGFQQEMSVFPRFLRFGPSNPRLLAWDTRITAPDQAAGLVVALRTSAFLIRHLVLAKDPLDRRPEHIVDSVSIAALIFTLASFGWTVYRDLTKDGDAAKANPAEMDREGRQTVLNEPRPYTLAEMEARFESLRRERGPEHSETLAAMLELAEMLWTRGRLAEVRAIEEHVLQARRRALGEAHGDTLKALGKLAATTGAQGDLDAARLMQEEVLARGRQAWGDIGRDTLRAMNNLAGTIAAQGDLAGARALLDHAIDTLHQEFGPADPDTLIALANLAAILWQFGERGEAYWLQSELIETRRQAFGDADAGTRAAVAVLAAMHRDGMP